MDQDAEDLNPYPDTCWLSPKAEVRPSSVQGLGLFAAAAITAGEIVVRLGGEVIDDAVLGRLEPPYSSVAVAENAHLLIDPGHPVRYGNHSCDPNLWHVDAVTIAARRTIAPGEELTVDYATHTGIETWSMACRCGAATCRRRVTGADWRLPALRAAYGEHWTPLLKDRINAAR